VKGYILSCNHLKTSSSIFPYNNIKAPFHLSYLVIHRSITHHPQNFPSTNSPQYAVTPSPVLPATGGNDSTCRRSLWYLRQCRHHLRSRINRSTGRRRPQYSCSSNPVKLRTNRIPYFRCLSSRAISLYFQRSVWSCRYNSRYQGCRRCLPATEARAARIFTGRRVPISVSSKYMTIN
jgi:hypothetical protein